MLATFIVLIYHWRYMKIGTKFERLVRVKVCGTCNGLIEDTGLCSYGCEHDGAMTRPVVINRVFKQVDTLLEETSSGSLTFK